ncbi:MAG: 4-hydroxy-2-oxovalerate aldolase [Proteobacteria bacterium]|jgi:4-hydroxy 2-oxovalerate aldolase|nr:4-hydroxy-2-oxovalerate aldolase [Pseudomonadota bacterium]
MEQIIITDSSLRDGNHSVKHTISPSSIAEYCRFADSAGIPIVEVGHGNGLAASSLLIGKSPYTDKQMLTTAKDNLKHSKLGVHTIPGLSTVDDAKAAIDHGVDVFRVATHCTEATLSKSHINFLAKTGKNVYGVLMMSALIDPIKLAQQASIMEDYGAQAIIIMDSTGTYLPEDVSERVQALKEVLSVEVGFHAHNNLGCAVANSLTAAQSGATLLDACIRGFGAGAGNAPLEVLLPVLERSGFLTSINFKEVIKEADRVMEYLVPQAPTTTPINVLTGLNKLFSGFEKPIIKASKLYGVEYSSLIFELGNRKLVAGQEDLILEVAQKLKSK